MTGHYFLDWGIIAVSLFNTILLLWLGLTVLLNAEHRTWGIWLAGGGLLLGGIFFVSHSAILGHGLSYVSRGMNFWWRVGWGPVVALPFGWYLVMLWYTGFWNNRQNALRRRQRAGLIITILLALGMVGLLIFANPLPSYTQVAQLSLVAVPAIGGIPLLIWIYPLYIVLCISLSLDALHRPEPSARLMGDLARQRARPWLMAAAVILLIVSLLVAWVMFWIILNARQRSVHGIYNDMSMAVGWFDLIIAGLIGGATVLLGQAIVSYEVFTGKTLPRRGLRQQWTRAVILAAGYGLVIGGSLALQLRLIYSLLLSAILLTLFYALLSWRSYAERERHISQLRPFVASQRLFDHLLTGASATPPEVDATTPFRALCEDILDAHMAHLIALGPLAPLVGPPLTYPPDAPGPPASLSEIAAQFHSPQTMWLPLDPTRYGGAIWAVPLWSERGLIGVVLLGKKRDGGLYTQEEIEITRASGERLIDTQASVEMARRLITLQRQRLADSQIIDQRTRRILHDDVLPQLHATMLSLSNGQAATTETSAEAVAQLTGLHHQIADLLHQMPRATSPEITRLGLINALRRVVEDELGGAFDRITWQIEPEAERHTQAIPSLTVEVFFYAAREAIRNAARHGRGEDATRPLALHIAITWQTATTPPLTASPGGLEILIEDNGVGLGTLNQANGGSGQGLALHSTMLAVVGGSLAVESEPEAYTRVLLRLPQ